MGYGINKFVKVMVDCQYSQDSTFGVIASSMGKYAYYFLKTKLRQKTCTLAVRKNKTDY